MRRETASWISETRERIISENNEAESVAERRRRARKKPIRKTTSDGVLPAPEPDETERLRKHGLLRLKASPLPRKASPASVADLEEEVILGWDPDNCIESENKASFAHRREVSDTELWNRAAASTFFGSCPSRRST